MGTRSVRITWAGESRPVYLALQNSLFEVCVGEGGVDDDVGMDVSAACVTDSRAPFPTMMEEEKGREEWRLPALEDMWFVAPVSRNHSEALGGGVATPAELSAWLLQTVPGDGGGSCGRW